MSHRGQTDEGEEDIFSDLQKWWGHYLESIGDIQTAKNFYHIAGEYLNVVRLLCMDDQLEEVGPSI